MLRRAAVVGMVFAALMGLSSVAASASPPQANGGPKGGGYCPAEGGFILVDAAPFAEGMAVDGRGNNNGIACVKFLSTPANAAAHFVALDDRDRASL